MAVVGLVSSARRTFEFVLGASSDNLSITGELRDMMAPWLHPLSWKRCGSEHGISPGLGRSTV